MPRSLEIVPSLAAMNFYHKITNNHIEIHYALIDGINDTKDDVKRLSDLLAGKEFNVKFLFYNEKETIEAHASNKKKYEEFSFYLEMFGGIQTEYYIAKGLDIGASCGQFLMDYYLEAQKMDEIIEKKFLKIREKLKESGFYKNTNTMGERYEMIIPHKCFHIVDFCYNQFNPFFGIAFGSFDLQSDGINEHGIDVEKVVLKIQKVEKLEQFYYLYIEKNMNFEEVVERTIKQVENGS
jgi:Predicted Fe-S-cluster redox enzyme